MKVQLLIITALAMQLVYSAATFRFTKMKCRMSAEKTCTNNFCYVKSYGRFKTKINAGCDFKTPLHKIYVDHATYYRQVGNFRQVIKTPQIEFCGWLKYGLTIPVYQQFVKIYQESFPGLLHECPYTSFHLYNYSQNDVDFSMWPSGEYKNVFTFSNDNDSKILELSIFADYNSKDKSDFYSYYFITL